MWPDRVLNPGPLIYESGALPTALRGPAILTELRHFGISYIGILGNFCIVAYRVCIINFSYNILWIIMKLCILLVDILKVCM